jgi:hypothetical protein
MKANLLNNDVVSKTARNFLHFLLCFTVVLFFSSIVLGQEKSKNNKEDFIETVSFCELIQNPKDFAEKKIKLKSIFRFGSEWSELYCLSCKGRIWFEYDDSFDALTKSNLRKKVKWSEKGRTLNIVAVGKLYVSGGYGHLGGYKYKFVAEYLEEAEVILKDSPTILPSEIKKKAKCKSEK